MVWDIVYVRILLKHSNMRLSIFINMTMNHLITSKLTNGKAAIHIHLPVFQVLHEC